MTVRDSASGRLGWWSPYSKRGTGGCVPTIGGSHSSASRVLERRIQPIVEPQIQEEQCGFRPGRRTLDQLYTLHRVFEGSWEFAQPVHMCFVDLEKAFDHVPHGILWEPLREYGVGGLLLSLVCIASSKSDLFPVPVGLQQGCPLSSVLLVFLWTKFLGAAMDWRGSGFGAAGSHLCFSQIMWSCWLLRARTSSMSWGSLQLSVKQLG